MSGGESKVQCCKEQYCIGTWKIRSMNQGKLEQEMARVNINIFQISELKWIGMGEFNLGDHCVYYCGQESLRRNGVATIVNMRVQNAVLGCSLTCDRMISVHSQGKTFNIRVIQVYAPTTDSKEAGVDWLTPSRANTEKDVSLIRGDWNAKVESQEILGVTGKFGFGVQHKAGQRLTVLLTLVIANTLF